MGESGTLLAETLLLESVSIVNLAWKPVLFDCRHQAEAAFFHKNQYRFFGNWPW